CNVMTAIESYTGADYNLAVAVGGRSINRARTVYGDVAAGKCDEVSTAGRKGIVEGSAQIGCISGNGQSQRSAGVGEHRVAGKIGRTNYQISALRLNCRLGSIHVHHSVQLVCIDVNSIGWAIKIDVGTRYGAAVYCNTLQNIV